MHTRTWAYIFVMTMVLVIMYYPSYFTHMAAGLQATNFSDDARQYVWPFLQYYDSYVFSDTYISDYIISLTPKGYQWLYQGTATLIDPRVTSKILPYLLLAIMLVFTGASAWRLAGPAAAWASLALCLSSTNYMANITGGLPRSFGFALVSAAIYALITGRPVMLAVVTVVSAGFYPPVAVLCGIALAFFVFLPRRWGGITQPWPARRRIFVLVLAGACTLGVLAPTIIDLSRYGESINTNDPEHLASFPERLGRHPLIPSRQVSWKSVIEAPMHYAEVAITSNRNPWSGRFSVKSEKKRKLLYALIFMIILTGYFFLLRQDVGTRRFMIMAVSVITTSSLAVLFNPHLYYPSRYAIYAVPIMTSIAFPVAIYGITERIVGGIFNSRIAASVMIIAGTLLILVLLGGRGPLKEGYSVEITSEELPIYEFIDSLPPSSLLAGWPDDPVVQNAPYFTGKMVLANNETQLVFHSAYTLEIRRRVNAIIDACFATSPEKLIALRDEFGVTHLIIRKEYYDPDHVPGYIPPFDARIAEMVAAMNLPSDSEVLRQKQAHVFNRNGILILDLDRISADNAGN